MTYDCRHCGQTFDGAYFRNRHEADCDPDEQTDTDSQTETDTDTDRLDPAETDRDLIEIPDKY
jgi:hypothetical protein